MTASSVDGTLLCMLLGGFGASWKSPKQIRLRLQKLINRYPRISSAKQVHAHIGVYDSRNVRFCPLRDLCTYLVGLVAPSCVNSAKSLKSAKTLANTCRIIRLTH
jgi:hypothetical protein